MGQVRGHPILVPMAWVLAALALGLSLLLLVLLVAWSGTPGVGPGSVWEVVPVLFFLLASPVVGALIVSRARPDHPIGWLFIVSSGALAFGFLVDMYATRAVIVGDDLATATWLRWAGTWLSAPAFASLPLFALLFPDGRPPSRKWTPVIWTTASGGVLLSVSEALRPELIILTQTGAVLQVVPNPIGVFSFAPAIAAIGGLALALILTSAVLATVALVLRFRGSHGIERQQLKWFVLAMGTLASLLVISSLMEVLASAAPQATAIVAASEVAWVLAISSLALLPIGAGVAVLRYRLYDIDVLINRALVYGALTAALAVAYVASVLVLQAVLRPFTAENEIAVAISTLAVVALFQPLRRRIQDWVDRRFYRSRYDAQRTLDAFAARLRGEVDLDSVRSDLVSVLQETVRPSHAGVWLREDR